MTNKLEAEGPEIDVTNYTNEQLFELIKSLRERGRDIVLTVTGVPQEKMDEFMAKFREIVPGAQIEYSEIREEVKKY